MPPKRVAGGAAISRGGVGGRPPEAAAAAASASSEAVAAAAAVAGKMKFPTVTLDAEATRRSLPWLRARHLDAFFQLPWDAQHSRLISDFLSGYDEITGCAELRGYRIAIDEPTIQEVFHLNSSSTQGLTQDLTQGLEQGEETDSAESFRSMFKPGAFVESNGWSTSLTHDPDIGYCLSKVSALLYLTTKPTYVSDNILSDLEAAARGTRSGTGVALAPLLSSPPLPRWSKILTSALQRNCARLKQHNSGRSYAGPHITMLVRHFCPLSDDEVLQLGGGSASSLPLSKRKRIPLVVRPVAPPPQPPPEPICCDEEVDQTMDRASEESDIQVERNPGLNQSHHHHHQSVPSLPPPPPPHSAAVTATVAVTPLVGGGVPSGGASPLRQDLDHALQVVARFAATAWTRDEMQSHLQGMQQQLVVQGGQIGALQHQVDTLKRDVAEERTKCDTWRGHMVRQQEETRALRHELGLVKEKLGSAAAVSDRPTQDHPPTGVAEELERIRAQANPAARAAVLQLLRENDELKARIEDLHTQLQLAGGGGGGGGGVSGVSRMPKKEAENIQVTEQR